MHPNADVRPKQPRNPVIRKSDQDGGWMIAYFGEDLALMQSLSSHLFRIFWHGQLAAEDDSENGQVLTDPGPWMQHLPVLWMDLVGRYGEDPGDTILLRFFNTVLPFLEEAFDIEQAKAKCTGFRLEWQEGNNKAEQHAADYATMDEARAAQTRLRRVGHVLASIRPLGV